MKFYTLFDKFPSFLVIGGVTSIVNIVFFWITFRFTSSIPISTLIGNGMSLFVNLVGLKQVFETKKWSSRLVPRYSLLVLAYYAAAVNLTVLGVVLGLTEITSRVLVIIMLAPITYLLNKYFVFPSS